MKKVDCPWCHAPSDIQVFLSGVGGFDRTTRSGFSECLNCKKSIEFQVRNRSLVIGYSYSSGSLHFEGLYDVPVSDLRCVIEERGVHYIYKGVRYDVAGSKASG